MGKKIFLAVIAITGTIALAAQFYYIIINRVTPVIETIIRYFSFFTIQTNILLTVCAVFILLAPKTTTGKFFSRMPVISAITLYIVVVGLVYNTVLRDLRVLESSEMIVDELLHVIMPILFLLFWIIYVPKYKLSYNILPWLIYPFVYAVYVITRGAITGYYSYPFLDAHALGYPQVLFNSGVLVLVFGGFALLMVLIGHIVSKPFRK